MATVHVIELWGDFACFSRPELKVERLSYPCITPSAARGILDAIYAKPAQFRWQVTRIDLLSEPTFIALRRNEVKEKVNVNAVLHWMNGSASPEPLWADADRDLAGTDERGRTQRQTMALKNVRYRVHAQMRAWPGVSHADSLDAQFQRRVKDGKCFHQPYFGCREFPAFFRLVEAADPEAAQPVPIDLEIGWMLYDVFDLSRAGSSHDAPAVSIFNATIRQGVLEVPPYESPAVLKTFAGAA